MLYIYTPTYLVFHCEFFEKITGEIPWLETTPLPYGSTETGDRTVPPVRTGPPSRPDRTTRTNGSTEPIGPDHPYERVRRAGRPDRTTRSNGTTGPTGRLGLPAKACLPGPLRPPSIAPAKAGLPGPLGPPSIPTTGTRGQKRKNFQVAPIGPKTSLTMLTGPESIGKHGATSSGRLFANPYFLTLSDLVFIVPFTPVSKR